MIDFVLSASGIRRRCSIYRVAAAMLLGILILAAPSARAQIVLPPGGVAAPGAPPQGAAGAVAPTPTPNPMDLTTTMTLSLNNVGLDQIIKFISDTTGKAVVKGKDVNSQVTIVSPVPVTRGRALEMIYNYLKLDGIYVVEQDGMLQLISAAALKNVRLRSISDEEDVQKIPDSLEVVQKIFKLRNIGVDDLKKHLDKLVPETAITTDPRSNTVILTDQLVHIKQLDRIIRALDNKGGDNLVTETFQLLHANAQDLANTLVNIISKTSLGGGTTSGPSPSSGGGSQSISSDGSGRLIVRSSGSGSQAGSPVQTGQITLVPDTRLNWLIVICPKDQLETIRKYILEFDNDKQDDLQTRTIPVEHAEADGVSQAISTLFSDRFNSGKDTVRLAVTDDGSRLLVYSSGTNFKMIQTLVGQLDTSTSEKRETHTYQVKHLEAQSLADQLTQLFNGRNGTGGSNNYNITYNYDYGNGGRRTQQTQPSFVPSPRTNTLMYLARPKDIDFIERMIKELDVEIDKSAFEPRIYHIRHTDATSLVNVLETLFQGKGSSNNNNDIYSIIYGRSTSDSTTDAIQSVFGKVRFVVDSITNTIVALSSNPRNYDILDAMVKKLDQDDPDSSEVMIYNLKYADPVRVANQINNLFSEGAVNRPNAGQNNQNNQNNNRNQLFGNNGNGNNGSSNLNDTPQLTVQDEEVFSPTWQSGNQGQQRNPNGANSEPRPVNQMIGNVRIVPDKRANTLMIAAPKVYFDALNKLILALDQDEPQVHIQARILEVTHGSERRVGIRWTPDPNSIAPAELENAFLGLNQIGFLDSGGGKSSSPFNVSQTRGLGGLNQTLTSVADGGNSILSSNINIALLVQLLQKNSKTRIVLDPNLTVHNNENGNLFIGSIFPFQTGQQTTNLNGIVTQTEQRKVGITLDIRPHINTKGQVVLRVLIDNEKVREGVLVSGGIVTDKTQLQTEIAMDSGQTMVIGGILEDSADNLERKVPLLGSIPLVGRLFRKNDDAYNVRELVFFLTPTVMADRTDADTLLQQTKERLKKLGEPTPLKGLGPDRENEVPGPENEGQGAMKKSAN